MTIQFNHDKTIDWDQRHNDHFSAVLEEDLDRFSEHVTRVEVHLSDQNGAKEGPNDIRCLIEVRVEGMRPIAVSDEADSVEQSISGATAKAKAALSKIVDRFQN